MTQRMMFTINTNDKTILTNRQLSIRKHRIYRYKHATNSIYANCERTGALDRKTFNNAITDKTLTYIDISKKQMNTPKNAVNKNAHTHTLFVVNGNSMPIDGINDNITIGIRAKIVFTLCP